MPWQTTPKRAEPMRRILRAPWDEVGPERACFTFRNAIPNGRAEPDTR